MALTPEDVASKRFTPTRFKPGYDEEEVDAFLDEVEAELRRLIAENADLRQQLQAAQQASPPATEPATAPAASAPAPPEPVAPPAPAPTPAPAQPAATGEEPQEQALRTLLLAQRTADEAIAQAKAEAEQLVSSAKSQAALIEQEAARQHAAAMVELQKQRGSLESAIDGLRAFEREYRTRLKAYLEGQLRDLESQPNLSPEPGTAATPTAPSAAAPSVSAQGAAPAASGDGGPAPAASPAPEIPKLAADPPPTGGSSSPFTAAPPVVPSAPDVAPGFTAEVDAGSDIPSSPPAEAGPDTDHQAGHREGE